MSKDFRLEEKDEYTHPLEDAKNFNESVYWNCFDPAQRMGAWFRLGNRANEGYAELSACLYLPDGRLAFMFGRPEISALMPCFESSACSDERPVIKGLAPLPQPP